MKYKVIMDRIRHEYYRVPVEAESLEQANTIAREVAEQKQLSPWDMIDSEEEWEIIEVRATPKAARCH